MIFAARISDSPNKPDICPADTSAETCAGILLSENIVCNCDPPEILALLLTKYALSGNTDIVSTTSEYAMSIDMPEETNVPNDLKKMDMEYKYTIFPIIGVRRINMCTIFFTGTNFRYMKRPTPIFKAVKKK